MRKQWYWSLPRQNWTTYFHFNNEIFSQNWLWFLPVLFLFDGLYLIISKARVDVSRITLKTTIGAAFITCFVYSFSMDVYGLRGWTRTALIDFQNERLLIYFSVFLLGSLCFRLKAFDSKPKSKFLYILAGSTAWIPGVIACTTVAFFRIRSDCDF